MAWPNKPTAEELIGMSGDELKTKLESAATKDDINNIKTGLEQSFSTSLNELRESLKQMSTPLTQADPQDPTTRVLVDPTQFVADETKDIRKMSIETQAQVMKMRARQGQFSNVFSQYGDDLIKKAYSFPVEQRASAWILGHLLANISGRSGGARQYQVAVPVAHWQFLCWP